MTSELVCPNCHVSLDERRLITHAWTVDTCPHCRAVVRRQEGFRQMDLDAINQEDVTAIDEWLEAARQDAADRGRPFLVTKEMGEVGGRSNRWNLTGIEVAGLPLPWSCAIEYNLDLPRVAELRLSSSQAGQKARENVQFLEDVCASHGVQPHLTQEWAWDVSEGDSGNIRWGVRQFLAARPLPKTLLAAVVRRLDRAMRDAAALLSQEAGMEARSRT